jgi:hypothetical protein
VATIDPIMIEGLAEFRKNLKTVESGLPKTLRLVGNAGAELIVDWARPRVPSDSGRARATVRAASTQTQGRVVGGGTRAPYYPWLDFGGRVGREDSVRRQFREGGRYIYPGLAARRDEVHERLLAGLLELCRSAGVEVD